MKKRFIVTLLLLAGLGTGVFAAEFAVSAGLGGNFGLLFSDYKVDSGDPPKYNAMNYGGFAFFDATYVELDVGLKIEATTQDDTSVVKDFTTTGTYFYASLLGKLPIELDRIILFPLLGCEYLYFFNGNLKATNSSSGAKLDEDTERSDLDDEFESDYIVINAGFGADFFISDSIFIRGEAIYGIRLNNKEEKDLIDSNAVKSIFKHGPTIKLAFGFRFGGY